MTSLGKRCRPCRAPIFCGQVISQCQDKRVFCRSVPYDSVLVEKRRLRPEGLSLGDITNDPEVDMSGFGYREDGPPRRGPPGRPIGPPNGPPGPDMGASTAMQLQGTEHT